MCAVTADQGSAPERVHHLRSGGVSLVVAVDGSPGLPRILYWGADLGELPDEALRELAVVSVAQVTSYVMDDPVPAAVLPEHALGYSGWPGVSGHRGGRDWSPLFAVTGVERAGDADSPGMVVQGVDEAAALRVEIRLELTPSGLVRARASLTNTHTSEPYRVDALHLALPVPPVADEVLDLAGRHIRERARSGSRSTSAPGCARAGGAEWPRLVAAPRRRDERVRLPVGRGVGGARRLERQPPRVRGAPPDRATRSSAAASCSCPAR